MMRLYMEEIGKKLDLINVEEKANIKGAAELVYNTMQNGHNVYTFGTGHSNLIALEMENRAGGHSGIKSITPAELTLNSTHFFKSTSIERIPAYAEVILETNNLKKNDLLIFISNSGINGLLIELAMKTKEKGIKIICITSLEHSKNSKSRHSSGKKLYELADIVIDNKAPKGDAILPFDKFKVAPISTITGTFIVHSLEIYLFEMERQNKKSIFVFSSSNVTDFDNDILNKKHMK